MRVRVSTFGAMPSQLHGIRNLVKSLEKIAAECGEKPVKEPEPKDQFLALKTRMCGMLEDVRNLIHERGILLTKRGNCQETIEKGHKIRTLLDELKRSLPTLQELHKKALKKRGAAQRSEELQNRYQDIRVLKRQIDEAHELFLTCNVGDAGRDVAGVMSMDSTLFGRSEKTIGATNRQMSEDEKRDLEKMRQRDQGLDQHADEVLKTVGNLREIATEIGSSATRTREKADGISTDVDKATDDLKTMNKKLTEVMRMQRNTECCCYLVLGVVLLCCVGFVFQQLQFGV